MNAAIRNGIESCIHLGLTSWDRVAVAQSLPQSAKFNEVLFDPSSSYEDVFLAGLRLRHFNFCLNDFSFFQLSAYGDQRRFAFYPNPFVLGDDLVELIEDPTDFDAFTLDELRATGSRSPIRYDVSPDAYKACAHPHSHFHIGHGELGRLACRRIILPNTFCLIIVKLFFPEAWSSEDFSPPNIAGFSNHMDVRLSGLLVTAGVLGVNEFSQAESSLPHFA